MMHRHNNTSGVVSGEPERGQRSVLKRELLTIPS
jgi:hypothetical protein